MHTDIQVKSLDWENGLGLAVSAANNLIFEAFAIWSIKVCFDFSIAASSVEGS
jgi:hypothetical protein